MDYKSIIVIIIVLWILSLLIVVKLLSKKNNKEEQIKIESPIKRVGRSGEDYVENMICSILKPNDYYFRNIQLEVDDRQCEIDNLIVNENGIFIIEVKTYSGVLYGNVNDYNWKKVHVSHNGKTYTKTVLNPIKQVNRQTYLLSQSFKKNNIRAWIDGYVYFVANNYPKYAEQILKSDDDIEFAIHSPIGNKIDTETINKIADLLSEYGAKCI